MLVTMKLEKMNIFNKILILFIIVLLLTQSIQGASYLNINTEKIINIVENSNQIINLNSRSTLYVGGSGSGNYTNIQDAIDDANSGDIIYVYCGTYYENIIIDKMVILKGEFRDNTVIDGADTGNVIKITADDVYISDFTIQNGGIGVYILYSNNHSIINNAIIDNWEGIGLTQTMGSIISNNYIYSNFFEGINPVQSSMIIISKNTIIGQLQGIFLTESENNIIYGNNIKSNTRGIEIRTSSNYNQIYHNNFISNNQDNAFDECSNTWDNGYPTGGNYWDDYSGVDNDGDGIGDTPYSISGGSNKDYYPFMDKSGWNQPPFKPINPSPENGATDVDINADLYWTGGDPDGDLVTYDIYFGNINPPPIIINNQSESFYNLETLNYNTNYYWKIISWDSLGASNQSSNWSFKTTQGQNNPPEIPTQPFGSEYGYIHFSYNYSTSSDDSDFDNISYGWDWNGDYIIDEWSNWYNSGDNCTISHIWNEPGTYNIRVKAKDIHYTESNWSIPLTVTITITNHPPNAPNINGPTNGEVGVEYEYNFTLKDIDNDQLYLRVDWGSQNFGPWQGPYNSDTTIKLSHTWNQKGTYTIKAQLKDIYDAESNISTLVITMPKNKPFLILNNLLDIFFQKFTVIKSIILSIQFLNKFTNF